jgi:hypothetical protein
MISVVWESPDLKSSGFVFIASLKLFLLLWATVVPTFSLPAFRSLMKKSKLKIAGDYFRAAAFFPLKYDYC